MTTIQTTEQLRQCIVVANTPSSNDSSTASSMLDAMCSAQDGGSKLCTALLREIFHKLSEASFTLYPITNENQHVINILFYSMTAIQRALFRDTGKDIDLASVDKSCRTELRQIIFNYILCVPTVSQTTMNCGEQVHGSMLPKFLRTKVGVVLSLLIQADFPERWPNAFHDLMQTINFTEINHKNGQMLENIPPTTILEIQRKDIFPFGVSSALDLPLVLPPFSYQKLFNMKNAPLCDLALFRCLRTNK